MNKFWPLLACSLSAPLVGCVKSVDCDAPYRPDSPCLAAVPPQPSTFQIIEARPENGPGTTASEIYVRMALGATNIAPLPPEADAWQCNDGVCFTNFARNPNGQPLRWNAPRVEGLRLFFSLTPLAGKVRISGEQGTKLYDLNRPHGAADGDPLLDGVRLAP